MHTALVLDIDGVVCPTAESSPWGELVEVGFAPQPVRVAPAVCAALDGLATRPGVHPVWLTSWLPQVRAAMRKPFPGPVWDQIDVHAVRNDAWPKWTALATWLTARPRITRVAWADDDLGTDRARHCADELGRRGIDTLLLAPAAEHGIGPPDLERLARWLSP